MKKLKTSLDNVEAIKKVLQHVDEEFVLHDGTIVKTLLIYLPCINNACDHEKLFDLIKQTIMTRFALSCTEIEKKLNLKCKDAHEVLLKKAIRKISQKTAQGELGELLLYTLLEVYFDAPKILSKISLKSSRRMPVYGADAVHAQYFNNDLILYLGESKLHTRFSSAAALAVKSITSILDKYEDEFDLIESHIDFYGLNEKIRTDLLDLLNPFSEENRLIGARIHSPCFIGFVEPSVFCKDEEEYVYNYVQIAKKHIETFYNNLRSNGNDIRKTALLLLPFSSIEDLTEGFISYMEIKK